MSPHLLNCTAYAFNLIIKSHLVWNKICAIALDPQYIRSYHTWHVIPISASTLLFWLTELLFSMNPGNLKLCWFIGSLEKHRYLWLDGESFLECFLSAFQALILFPEKKNYRDFNVYFGSLISLSHLGSKVLKASSAIWMKEDFESASVECFLL